MTDTPALDDLIANVRRYVKNYGDMIENVLDDAVAYEMQICPEYFYPALQDPRYLAYCQEQDYVESEGFLICSHSEQTARLEAFKYRQKHPRIDREYESYHDQYCCPLHGCKYGNEDCPVVGGRETGAPCEEACEKCGGAGWLWADELDHFEGNPSFDDTKYTCDGCRRNTK